MRRALLTLPYLPFLVLFLLDPDSFLEGHYFVACVSAVITQLTLMFFWTALRGDSEIERQIEQGSNAELVFGTSYRTTSLTAGILMAGILLFALYSLRGHDLNFMLTGITSGLVFTIFALSVAKYLGSTVKVNPRKYALRLFSGGALFTQAVELLIVGIILTSALVLLIIFAVSLE